VDAVTVRVPAKINLQLAVGPLRPDGYHDLVTVFHAISLSDEVTVTPAKADRVRVSGEGADHVPEDRDNLALKAVAGMRAVCALRGIEMPDHAGADVTIRKRIPVAAGLAGGSADAAAALVACNEMWDAGLSQQELCEVSAGVGSDVAFAVIGGTAVGRGRGERLTPALVPQARYHWVVAVADGHLSTPKVYGTLDRLRGESHVPDPDLSSELMSALRSGDPARLGPALSNDLQYPAIAMSRAAQDTRHRAGPRGARRAGVRLGADLPLPGLGRRPGHEPGGRPRRGGRLPRGDPRDRPGHRCHRGPLARPVVNCR
jgi:4-diphosphocytidyl-2-C-methyl-D-erythritol kinase